MVVGYEVLHFVNNKDMYKTQRCKDAVTSFRENNALSHFLHYIIAFKISLIYACLGLWEKKSYTNTSAWAEIQI